MNQKTIISFIVIILFLGGLYWMMSGKTPETGTIIDTNQSPVVLDGELKPGSEVGYLPVEPAAVAARKDLAAKLSVDEKSIVIMQITETEWSDGCLGLGGPAESCLQALVPGFKVEMLAKGKTYFYRTDKTGEVVRAEGK